MAKLLVNADDFGLHPSVNKAIENCFLFGSVNSTSVIANGSALNVELLLQLSNKGLLTGAHITWVNERWLTADIYIHDWLELLKRIALGGSKFMALLKLEAEAQTNLLLQHGIPLQHIDSHQHVHHLLGLWNILWELKQQHSIPRIRVARVNHSGLMRKNFSGIMLNYLARRIADTPAYYCAGIKYAGNYNFELLNEELTFSAGTDTELIVHPGLSNKELNERYDRWHFNWENEYKTLMQPQFLQVVKRFTETS
jgi:predicted glycoside hydrolase/deacetylase ChbG (UPF0249 family)